MSEVEAGGRARGAIPDESAEMAARGVAYGLGLAAAPTFAIMALLTAVLGGGPADMLCSGMQDAWPLGGMVPMYVLMSAFHSSPWLKLMFGRRSRAEAPKSLSAP